MVSINCRKISMNVAKFMEWIIEKLSVRAKNTEDT
jgi:hypothetical protein